MDLNKINIFTCPKAKNVKKLKNCVNYFLDYRFSADCSIITGTKIALVNRVRNTEEIRRTLKKAAVATRATVMLRSYFCS